jgi:hypothetical protein
MPAARVGSVLVGLGFQQDQDDIPTPRHRPVFRRQRPPPAIAEGST